MTNTKKQTVLEMLTKRVLWFFALPNHWFAWVVAGLTTVAMVIICVPGVVIEAGLMKDQFSYNYGQYTYNQGDSNLSICDGHPFEQEFGWPFVFMETAQCIDSKVRACDYFGPQSIISYPNYTSSYDRANISWTTPEAWKFSGDITRLRPHAWLRVLANISIATSIILLSTRLAERWVNLRGSVFRLKLSDLAIIITSICLLLGWRSWNKKQQHYSPKKASCDYKDSQLIDLTPRWLHRLLGSCRVTPWDNHHTNIFLTNQLLERRYPNQYSPSWTPSPILNRSNCNKLQKYFFLRKLTYCTNTPLTCETVDLLKLVDNAEDICIHHCRPGFTGGFLVAGKPDFSVVPPREVLLQLTNLPNLSEINFFHHTPLLIEDLELLLGSTSLKKISLDETMFRQEDLYAFKVKHSPKFKIEFTNRRVGSWENRRKADTLTELDIAHYRLARWRNDIHLATHFHGIPDSHYKPDVDVSNIKLSDPQLEKLLLAATEIELLKFNKENNGKNAVKLINQCDSLHELHIGNMPLSHPEIESLSSKPELKEFHFDYGSLSVKSLKRLPTILKLEKYTDINIYNAEEILENQELLDAIISLEELEIYVTAFAGEDNDSEEVHLPDVPRMPYLKGGEDDPFADF